jgi:hypothetical protein
MEKLEKLEAIEIKVDKLEAIEKKVDKLQSEQIYSKINPWEVMSLTQKDRTTNLRKKYSIAVPFKMYSYRRNRSGKIKVGSYSSAFNQSAYLQNGWHGGITAR